MLMPISTAGFRPTRFAGGIALALLAALAATGTAAAQATTPPRAWFVALDLAFAEPGSADQHYADQIDLSGSAPRGTRHVLDNEADLAPRLTVGYDFGPALGSLRVSYWSFDNEDSESKSLPGIVEPALFGYGYYGSAYLYDAQSVPVEASATIEASVVDVSYTRMMEAGRKLMLGWVVGMRTASFKENREFYGRDDLVIVEQSKSIDNSAYGFKFGANAQYKFGSRFRLEGGLALSLMQGDSEGTAEQTMRDADPNTPAIGLLSETRDAEQDSISGQILDLDAKGVWTMGAFEVWVGYGASSWNGLVADPNPSPPEGDDRDSLSFTGWRLGAKWRFGGSKPPAP